MLERGVAVVTVGFPATPVSCLRVDYELTRQTIFFFKNKFKFHQIR
jgi:hypothetical protein